MKKIWLIVTIAALLVGCARANAQGGEDGTSVDRPIKAPADVVIAEGQVEPTRRADLCFPITGQVDQVLVAPGDRIAQGAPLVRLDSKELALLLQSAQQDLAAQQAARDMLLRGTRPEAIARADKENADQIAQAEVALHVRELEFEKAQTTDPDAEVEGARARVTQLELQLARLRAQDPAPTLAAAQIGLERAQIALEETQDEYNKALDRPWEDQSVRDHWAKRLQQAQLDHRLTQAQLDEAEQADRAHEIELAAASAQVRQARLQLDQTVAARKTYTATLDILAAQVQAAQLQLEALRTWDNPYLDVPLQEEIDQAETQVRKAEMAVRRMQFQLHEAELRAPFAGTVVRIEVEPGDRAAPGQVVVVLATLDQLCVQTTDLTELDVPRVTLDARATIEADALPGQQFNGRVREIDLRGDEYRGDTVYRVEIELLDPPAGALRWGMTTAVEIKVQ
jgi:HlyD family secretion protein